STGTLPTTACRRPTRTAGCAQAPHRPYEGWPGPRAQRARERRTGERGEGAQGVIACAVWPWAWRREVSMRYDADKAPNPQEWLGLDGGGRPGVVPGDPPPQEAAGW